MKGKRTSDSCVYYAEEEEILAKWASACQIKCRLHRVATRHYAHHSKNTTIIILVLQTCAGSLTLSNDVPTWAEPLVALLQLSLAVCLAIASYLKMGERSEAHRNASISYGEIYHTLSTLLVRRSSERPPAVGVIDTMLQTLIQLDKNSPILPMKLCAKEAQRSNIADRFKDTELPDELNGLAKVKVYGRELDEEVEKGVRESDEIVEEITAVTTPDSIALSPIAHDEFVEPIEEEDTTTSEDNNKE